MAMSCMEAFLNISKTVLFKKQRRQHSPLKVKEDISVSFPTAVCAHPSHKALLLLAGRLNKQVLTALPGHVTLGKLHLQYS